jgi:nucleoside-diphosphate-sugar epimerase
MRVAVTGAAGFIGSHVCERLLAAGHEVSGLDSMSPFYPREQKQLNLAALRQIKSFRFVEQDVLEKRLGDVMGRQDAIVHLAGRAGVRANGAPEFERDNVRGTAAVVEAAAERGIERVVLGSSSSVYGPAAAALREDAPLAPLSDYGRSKARAESAAARIARIRGLELVRLRYFTVYGPRQRPDMAFSRFLAAAAAGRTFTVFGDGRQVRDFTYVGDAVEATLLALTDGRPGAVYNVSGGRPTTLADALTLVAASSGVSPSIRFAPADSREPPMTAADLSRACRELGYEPQVGLAEGVERQLGEAVSAAA